MSDDDKDDEHLHLVSNREPMPHKRSDEAVALGNVYATAKGQRAAEAIEFRRKDGTSFTMPYGYRPILWGHPPASILVEYPGFFTVALTVVGHGELLKRLGAQQVTWIRECDESLAASLPVAVTRIEILRAYPSREVGTESGT
jgi:hypothetical protein